MQKNRFNLTWITNREHYDRESRSNLLGKVLERDLVNIRRVIDLGCGTGAFLRWCLTQQLFFDEAKLIDYDRKLLDSVYVHLKSSLKSTKYSIKKVNSREYLIKNSSNNSQEMSVIPSKKNILSSLEEINKYDLVSLSSLSDLLSKNTIRKLFSNIGRDKYLYFSLCFDGTIKWYPTNKFDKYIENKFNAHQLQDKGFGIALGKGSLKYIELTAKKKSFACKKKDSSWRINSLTKGDKIFQKKYLDIILKALKKDNITDKNILNLWYINRADKIKSSVSKLVVGHRDIIIKT
ncbi:MAG: hypothetical protein VYE31_01940 [Pseudomonadota bacterium]|nr:hypothetical protein [Pseudomonadota bacterium]